MGVNAVASFRQKRVVAVGRKRRFCGAGGVLGRARWLCSVREKTSGKSARATGKKEALRELRREAETENRRSRIEDRAARARMVARGGRRTLSLPFLNSHECYGLWMSLFGESGRI